MQQLEVELGALAAPGGFNAMLLQWQTCAALYHSAHMALMQACCCIGTAALQLTKCVSYAASDLKANLFAKDFKKQVLAAEAIKAWVNSSPDEVSTTSSLTQFSPCCQQ